MSTTTVADAKIDRAQLEQIMAMLDKNKDGKVTAVEFKVPWMKLFPKLKDADFEEAWKKIDENGDGELSMEELATYYGFDLTANAMKEEEMDDAKILEMLQMQAALVEMEDAAKKRKADEEAEKEKKLSGGKKTSSTGAREKHRTSSGVVSVKMPGKVTECNDDANVLFIQSCELGDVKAVMAALSADKDFTGRVEDDKGEMPLHKLSRYPQGQTKACIKELLERSKKNETVRNDLNWQDKQGKTPLFYAAENGNKELVMLYLDRGADPFIKDNNGGTVLHAAAQGDKIEVARDLFGHSKISPADGSTSIKKRLLNTTDKSGRTALHIAAFKSKEGEMVQLLLAHGADPNITDSNGNTGAKLANKTGRRKSKELLDDAMAGSQ